MPRAELSDPEFVQGPMADPPTASYGGENSEDELMTRNRSRQLLISLILLGAGGASGAESGEAKSDRVHAATAVHVAGQPGEQRLGDFLNRPVLAVAGTNLGRIEDFLVDRTSGRVAYALVEIPQAPLHERRRLLRGDALRWQPAAKSFAAEARSEVPVDEEKRLLEQNTFLRATSLPGKAVRSDERAFGRVTDLVVDPATRTAALVVSPDANVMRTLLTFVLPMSRVRVGAGPELAVTTTVTPEELARVEVAAAPIAADGSLPTSPVTGASGISQSSVSGQRGFATPQSVRAATTAETDAGVIDEPLAPTGRDPRAEEPGTDPVSRAAHAVRGALHAMDGDASGGVAVSAEDGSLVLRGSVPSQAVKERLERRAAGAARGIAIESRIVVRESR